MYPCALGGMVAGMLAVCLAVAAERHWRLAAVDDALLLGREGSVPNYHHMWFAHDLVFTNGKGGQLCAFGQDFASLSETSWSDDLCHRDSDGDGLTNGEELGDPCCGWGSDDAGSSFVFSKHKEYRRWGLSHPGGPQSDLSGFPGMSLQPQNCSSWDHALYAEQFRKFYFYRADGAYEPTDLVVAKVISLLVLVVLVAYWVLAKGLAADVAPWLSPKPHITGRTSLVVMLLSFLYMDVTSGVVHLILDYAPHWLPVLGGLARGFQYHHHDPTAIIRISWYAYVSHVHLLIPIVAALIVFSDASRVQRLFWFWGAIFVHLFQTTHRWSHFPPESLPWWVRLGQESGLLLTHARHMRHHEDLEKQFTILSGHTDLLLDSAVALVPPIRYDLWLFFGVAWFMLPVVLDTKFRQVFESLEHTKLKVVDEQGITVKDSAA